MIKKLRRKLIAASMFSLTVVLLVILGGINLMSYCKIVNDADAILAVLGDNSGTFPMSQTEHADNPMLTHKTNKRLIRSLSPETPYESRYFSVLIDRNGQVLQTDTGQIAAIDAQDAASYALRVWQSGGTQGFVDRYRYLRQTDGDCIRMIFLDCTRSLSSLHTTLFASVSLALIGLTAVFVLLLFLSKRIIRPVIESDEKQKRFITDAGHELKTPLTIIGADTDLAEMECGENQWLSDIRRQAQRLTGLTNDLIYLSRMEEEQPKLQRIEFPLSDVVEEMAQSFAAPAKSQGKTLSIEVQPMLSYTGDEKSIRQLVSILMDNALKYTPTDGHLSICLKKHNRNLLLSVSNTTTQIMDKNSLSHLFDRFYRMDQSRNAQTGGYGLGLSIAQSIVTAHKGKIRAESPDPKSLTITVSLTA